jgi:hypothetical protein
VTLVCPECSTEGWLKITNSLELPYDSRSDEITLQVIKCMRCRFETIAVYEESRRGGFGDESVDHRGYYVSESDLQWVKKQISHCPSPRNGRCRCKVHRKLGHKDKNGRWDGLAQIELGRRFAIEMR